MGFDDVMATHYTITRRKTTLDFCNNDLDKKLELQLRDELCQKIKAQEI